MTAWEPTRMLDWLFESNRFDLGTAESCLPVHTNRYVACMYASQHPFCVCNDS